MLAHGGARVTKEGYFDAWKYEEPTFSSQKLILNTVANALDGERRSQSWVPRSYRKGPIGRR